MGKMELQTHRKQSDQLTLATRKCLFRLLSFLDGHLPERSAVNTCTDMPSTIVVLHN